MILQGSAAFCAETAGGLLWTQPGTGPGGNWYLPPGKPPLGIMQPYLARRWSITNFHPDEALMAVRSPDCKWILAEAWHDARYLIANIHDHYECTDVCPDVGEIEAGETILVQSKVYFVRGSLADLECKYNEDLKRKKVSYQHRWKNPSRNLKSSGTSSDKTQLASR